MVPWTESDLRRNSRQGGNVRVTMTTIAQDAPEAPTPPPVPVLPEVATGVPQTLSEVLALRAQRSELSDQLQSAARRRAATAEQLSTASPVEKPGLEARLKLLDARIVQIEAQIDRTGQLIAQAPGTLLATADAPNFQVGGGQNVDITLISTVATVFVLAPLAFALARNLWKRGSRQSAAPTIDRETAERLRRLEQGIDSIALEVERISEGQRFVTKLMSERAKARVESGE